MPAVDAAQLARASLVEVTAGAQNVLSVLVAEQSVTRPVITHSLKHLGAGSHIRNLSAAWVAESVDWYLFAHSSAADWRG